MEFIALWTVPFGGNCGEKIKQIASASLAGEISCLCAAMDALRAFIIRQVQPVLGTAKGDELLAPVLAYFGG